MAVQVNLQDDARTLFPGDGEMAARCRAFDWATTPLGPTPQWPTALRTLVRTAIESPFPINLWCGPSLTLIYNDAYRTVLGSKHPSALGRPGAEVWSEIWPGIARWFDASASREVVFEESARFEMDRGDGRPGEAWFTFGLSPVRDEHGQVVAYFNPATETTARILAERELTHAREHAEQAEHRLREVFAQAPAFLAVVRGPDHVFEFSNDAYQRLVGDRPIIGKSVREALPEVTEQGFVALLDQVYRSREPFVGREIPILLARSDGLPPEEVFVDFVYQPLTNRGGDVEGIVAHGFEVTDAVHARHLVEASETRYRFLADAIPVQVWTATTDGRLDYVNQRAESYFAQPMRSLIGDAWQENVHPDDAERAGALWAHALLTGEPYMVEFRLRRADGVYRWHLARATAQRGADGGLLRWYGTNTDIEAAKQNEAELERLKNDAMEANRAKSDFLAAMSHELRTPLNAIGGYAQLIELGLRGAVTPEQVEDLRKIQRSKDHLNTLVGGVLAFAKGGAGRIEIEPADLEVAALIDSVLDMVQPQLEERGLTLVRETSDAGLTARADLDKARQILLNLFANALKFTPAGGRIAVEASTATDIVRVHVSDTGIGIPPDDIERIFEPFMQAGRAVQSTDGGVGLGLAISRQLARAMGGDLTVVSPPGRGSTFTLSLPGVAEGSAMV